MVEGGALVQRRLQARGPAIIITRWAALGVQGAWNVHGTHALVLPNVYQFVDEMRIGQGAPGIDTGKTHIGKTVVFAAEVSAFVHADVLVPDLGSEYRLGQRQFPLVQGPCVAFEDAVEQEQPFREVQTVGEQKKEFQQLPNPPCGKGCGQDSGRYPRGGADDFL